MDGGYFRLAMPYFYRDGLGCSKVALEGHDLGGLRSLFIGFNKRNFKS